MSSEYWSSSENRWISHALLLIALLAREKK